MRTRLVVGSILLAAMLFVGIRYLPEMRLRGGLENAGVSRPLATCMAHRMVKRLSYIQLWRLAELPRAHDAKSRREWLHRVRALEDPRIVAVTTGAAARCVLGIDPSES